MKKILPILLATSLSQLAVHAQDQPASADTGNPEAPTGKQEKSQFVLDIEALTEEKGKEYRRLFLRCDQLFKQKRIFECLETLSEIHEIYDGNPATLNLQGACYVEFRSFDKARAAFQRALKEQPENFNVHFNLAEIEFVTKDYKEALKQLQALKKEASIGKPNEGMLALVDFKILLCMLKTDDLAGAKKIVEGTDFLDDSPLHYYGQAALEYEQDRGTEAEIWLARAGRIFRNPAEIAPWQDTLIEFGYIKSFYGGDLEVEE